MTDLELIRHLASLGVKLWVEGDALKFSAPKGALTDPLRARLRERKDALRTILLRASQPGDADRTIPRIPRGGPLPLSFGQERLWFLHQLDPADVSYAVPLVLRFDGPLDRGALGRALDALVARHEVLRTTFELEAGQPVARIHDAAGVALPVASFAALPEGEREAAARAAIDTEIRVPFDLARGPVVRARLFEIAPGDHVLLLVLHHIASDGWTNDVLGREIRTLLAAFSDSSRAPGPVPLAELPIQYADFAAWQRRRLEGGLLEEQLGYWKEALAGAPPFLDLPLDGPRPRVPSHRGALVRFALDAGTSRALDALARREGATLFMVLLAAFDVLLYRWSGQADLSVGSPTAGRVHPETEPVAGFFVNTLVLRAQVDPEASFLSLLGRVREACLGAYAHQEVPFERVVQALDPARDTGRSPLFQAMFVLQTGPAGTGVTSPAEPAPHGRRGVGFGTTTAKFDLNLAMAEGPGGLVGTMEYATDLFERATIERMVSSFGVLLGGIAAGPEARVRELPLLAEDERLLLAGWNDTASPYPRSDLTHELVEAQARRAPDAIAVTSGGQAITYGELVARGRKLARRLRALGVAPGGLVGIAVERSVAMVVGLLGILSAGAAYVPMDPRYPRERLSFMASDAGLSLLLTQASLLSAGPGRRPLPEPPCGVFCIDADWPSVETESGALEPEDRGGPESLAYVIYTSGSTGTPKGVEVPHRALVNFLFSMARSPGLDGGDRLLALTSLSFDIAGLELWLPLAVGACVEIASAEEAADGAALARRLGELAITVVQGTPSTFRLLLGAGWSGSPRLRALIGGEAVPPQVAGPLAERVDALWNMYGPTETTIWSTIHRLHAGEPVLVGRPIANTRVYVLDAAAEPVPVGVRGELYIGGDGVARGYLRRPHLTAERFVCDPFASEPGARMYRTGDVARWLPSGTLEYLGRADFQVKIRGFRIELGEIEAALASLPSVREAVVLVREDSPGDTRLVAYLVCEGRVPAAADLRASLGERLPEHMVPSAFVGLDALPLTSNGKLDRRALPPPGAGAIAARAYVAPRGPVEEALAGIFAEVLRLPASEVGAHGGFFELGGHSLLATQAIARLRAALGVELPLRALFEAPSPAALALRVAAATGPVAPPITRVPADAPRVPSFAEERLWFIDQLEPGDPTYVVPLAMRLGGTLDEGALHRALVEIVRRHEVLRTAYRAQGGMLVPVVHPPEISLPVERLDDLPEAEREARVRREIAAEARRSFDLAAGPVIRARLLALGERDHVLLVSLHHIVCDGWSLGVLGREISLLYGAFAERAGAPSPLPELPVQYGDYAAWQRSWLSGEVLDQQLAFWKGQLAGAPPALDLPSDRPRPPVPSHQGAHQPMALPAELRDALVRVSREQGATLFMTLLAALGVLLGRYAGESDLVVGTPIAGRTRAEIEGLIGFFVNTLAIRVDLGADPTFAELVGRVREACLGAYAHQDMPFERLVQELEPVRDPSRSPIFQVAFVLQNAPGETAALPGLERRTLGAAGGTAKFDLTFALVESPRGLSGVLEYATDLFDRATAERMAGHYAVLLAAAAAAPGKKLWELDLAGEDERRRIAGFAGMHTAYPRDATIHALFAAQVAATPDATAVALGSEQLSYGALDAYANRLAHRLRALGAGPRTKVALYARRSLEMVAATLAILKAGAAYVPLDPEMPDARLAWMLEDAGATVVVTAGASLSGRDLGAGRGAELVLLSASAASLAPEAASLAAEPDTELSAREGSGESLAYVMYTSGSTGRPKGVCVPHRGVVRLVKGTDYARFGADEVFLQLAPIAFDAATFEIWGALLNGGRLEVFPPEPPAPALLGKVIRSGGVTTLWLTAGLFNTVIDTAPEGLRPLRQLLTGGEALSVPHVQKALAELPGVQLVNGYGPTEGTTFTCCHPIASAGGVTSIPIGRPIANTTVFVLDEHGQPVPIGVPGELYAGGDGVALGYLNRPDLDAERFVPDRFRSEPGARLYRTGDRVRWLADGTVAFLGRRDLQVKLRGYRIELGEIEAVLGACPDAGECVVVVREDAPGDRRLVAYVAGGAAGPAALRVWLQERLPDYMVPAAFVSLAALPLTPNGKVDRRALPAPDAGAYAAREHVPPRGPIEETLAGIFAEVLRFPAGQVGARDGFFELGGHSLLAAQAIARIRAALGVELPLRALFEAPSPAELCARVEAALREGQGIEAPPLVPQPRLGLAGAPVTRPLSFAEERLWFLHQLDPGDPSYVVPVATELAGALDADVLGRALGEIVQRHEVLRTTFALAAGSPVAVVHPEASVDLPVTSLAGVPEAERWEALRRALAEASARPFDLATGPVIRAHLFALGPEAHVLLVALHHIVCDGWSIGVLSRELGALYGAFRRGEPSPLPALHLQYADYAAWQRGWLSGEVLARQLAYWRGRLGDAPRALDLPTDRPRPAVPSHRGDTRPFALGAEPTRALRELARREGATLFMTLLAAFDVLLYRWSGQTDVVVGTPVANRTHAETEGLVGFFVNTLVLRAELDPEQSFREHLGRVRETCLGAYAHQDVPFERLVQELDPERNLGRAPLFQVMFALQTAPSGGPALDGIRRRGVAAGTGTAKFDLTLGLAEGAHGLAGSLELATDLFDASTAERMLASFGALLEGLAAPGGAQLRLRELPVLPAGDQARLAAFAGDASFPVDGCLHERFEAEARRSPDAVAVTCEGACLTYAVLDRRANQVASALRKRGVEPETLVGLCADRSLDLIVGMLGILKAGGAYLPLDPDYPRERLAFMIQDARAAVVLTQARHAGALGAGPEILLLDAGAEALAAEPGDPSAAGARPEHLAYVIYTSGSTGRPKGVMVEHQNVVRLFTATEPWYGFGARDVWTMFHSSAFDFSVWEIWGALLYGGRLVVVPYWVSRSPDAFLRLLAEEQVTMLSQTPSAFRQLVRVEAATGDSPPSLALRQVVFGGEALDVGDLAPFWDRHGDEHPRLVNMYGITETTVHVTYRPVSRADLTRPWSSVIGGPIPDLSVHVLDAYRQPVPIGVPGEMYVGGAGVARGYLDRPELSAERFLADPFRAGGRLYRTGDLARWLGSGELEYLGRIDHQVKIRGFRIELGEVEAALDQHPAVREAVVVAREDTPGDKRLVAYLVCEGALPPARELRTFLGERLPEHMVPAAFVGLDALPLTSNGKIDRRALPAPGADAAAAHDHVAPRGPVEEALASIFIEVLGLPAGQVGAHDGFFALGGHSLLAVQAVSRVRAALGVDLPLRALFEAPTVAELAACVQASMRQGAPSDVSPIPRVPRDGPRELSFGEERLWVLHQLDPADPSYVVPLALRLAGVLDAAALGRALGEIVRRHELLRTTFETRDGRPVAVVHDGVDLPLPIDDLRGLPLPEREARAREASAAEARRSFDLVRGPVVRARLLVLGEGDHLLLLSTHHIVSDAWSSRVLVRELALLHDAFREGRPSPLAELPIQYADFAAWQRRRFTGDEAHRQLAYWRGALEGAPRVLDLPADRPRPKVATHRGGLVWLELPAALSASLDALCRREGTTLFMTLFAVFAALLYRHTGQDDLLVGVPVANRDRPDTEGLIGFFLSTLVLRARIRPDLPFRALLASVRETCLGAYAHQEMPFERLVQELDPERDLGRAPLFQVLFTVYDTPHRDAGRPSGGLRAHVGMGEGGTSRFDLSLALGRGAGGGIEGSFEYATDLFDASTVERMAARLRVLCEGAASDAGRPIGELPLLSEAERILLAGWNDTASPYPRSERAHELVEAQARRAPDAIAVTSGGQAITYGELVARGRKLARRLRALGVAPGGLVGIAVERSVAMVVGLLGILSAGAAYVPMDPRYPRERLSFMASDAGLSLLLTQASLLSAGPGRRPLPEPPCGVFCIDADWPSVEAESGAPELEAPGGPESLAYVIYTSGSTGMPKGVEVPHRALVNFLFSMARSPGLDGGDRLLALTSLSFDIAGLELWLPLAVGARVEIASAEEAADGAALARRLGELAITVVQGTPSTFRLLLGAGWSGSPHLRALIGGEAVPPQVAGPLAERVDALWNMYGPTETTIWSTIHRLHAGEPVLIGRPIANTRVYVLDADSEPVPVGVRGELYIGGDGVARGYLRRPHLTAERFVCDPFASEPSARMYRTGDVARWLPSGTLEYLGRADFQVKIRGFRIELGEIEAALLSLPSVREAVVVAREDVPGRAQLVAYLVAADPGARATVGELRERLGERLPEYMIPAVFVSLAALPLTANGKVDRRALPAPDEAERPDLGEAFVAPEGPVEEALARIWAAVLRRDRIGARDNFFALGGDSILGIQIAARASEAGIRITPRQIFQYPTLAELAAAAGTVAPADADEGIVASPVHLSQDALDMLAGLDPEG